MKNDDIEDELIEAKVTVNRQNQKRLTFKQNGNVRVKVVNRKFVRPALVNINNLNRRYGDSKIYLNDSFIPEFNYFNYLFIWGSEWGKPRSEGRGRRL